MTLSSVTPQKPACPDKKWRILVVLTYPAIRRDRVAIRRVELLHVTVAIDCYGGNHFMAIWLFGYVYENRV